MFQPGVGSSPLTLPPGDPDPLPRASAGPFSLVCFRSGLATCQPGLQGVAWPQKAGKFLLPQTQAACATGGRGRDILPDYLTVSSQGPALPPRPCGWALAAPGPGQ